MNSITDFIKNKYIVIAIIVIILLTTFITVRVNAKDNNEEESVSIIENNDDVKEENDEETYVYVDVKGAVKKPGVYQVSSTAIVNDAINMAGGLLSTATTVDINLSKKVYNEMIIYISTKTEYKKKQKKSSDNSTNENNATVIKCDAPTSSTNNKEETAVNNTTKENNESNNKSSESQESTEIININTATKEDLLKIKGIGETKADKIILYRKEKGLFNCIEEIKNVSGIGETIFEKIKDYIRV